MCPLYLVPEHDGCYGSLMHRNLPFNRYLESVFHLSLAYFLFHRRVLKCSLFLANAVFLCKKASIAAAVLRDMIKWTSFNNMNENTDTNHAVKMLATKTCAVSSMEAGSCMATYPTCQTTVRHACCF